MANIKSAVKRARQNTKLRQRNTSARSMFRTFVKNVLKAVELKDKEAATKEFDTTLKSISLNMTPIEFQREVGRLEVLGELLIRDKK